MPSCARSCWRFVRSCGNPQSDHRRRRLSARPAALRSWLDRAATSGIGMIEGFVGQLRRNVLAVEAAVTERCTNGPVKGHVNRLKTLTRQMYGRAGVELLRARLIPL